MSILTIILIVSTFLTTIAGLLNKKNDWYKKSKFKIIRESKFLPNLPTAIIIITFCLSLFSIIFTEKKKRNAEKKQLNTYEKKFSNTVDLIVSQYNPVEYDFIKQEIDTSVKIRLMISTVFEVSRLLGSELSNPILSNNKTLTNNWDSLTNNLKKINFPLSGYDRKPVETMRADLARYLRSFITEMQTYYLDHKNSYQE